MNSEMIKSVKLYKNLGLAILPLHSIDGDMCTCGKEFCKSPGKHPQTPRGVHDASSNTTDLEAKLGWGKNINIGIATGAKSGVVVLDIDPKNGGDASLHKLIEKFGPLPETLKVTTGGGGRHFYFKCSPEGMKTVHGKQLGAGLDFQANGAYVVAPPSLHASGKRYEWDGAKPGENEIAELPTWLKDLIENPPTETPSSRKKPKSGDGPIPEGQRNDNLTSIGEACAIEGFPILKSKSNSWRSTPSSACLLRRFRGYWDCCFRLQI